MSSSTAEFQLRELLLEDCQSLQQLHQEIDASPWKAKQFAECSDPPHRSFVAIVDSQLVGFLIFVVIDKQAEILNFGIEKSHQGLGLGRKLLSSACEELPTRIEELFLDVRVSNLRASNLYHSIGFETVAVRREYYRMAGGGREDGLVMKLQITATDT